MDPTKACAAQYASLLKNMHYEIELNFPTYHTTDMSKGDWAKLFKRFSHEGLGFLTVTLPTLGKSIISSFKTGHIDTPTSFKMMRGSKYPILYNWLFNRIYEPSGFIRDNPCKAAIRLLTQLCFMFYKLELPYKPRQTQKVMDKYFESERACKSIMLIENDEILRKARDIVTQLFKDFDPLDIVPRTSNGSLATGEKGADKFVAKRKFKDIHRIYPYYDYFVPTPNLISDQLRAGSSELLKWYKELTPEKSGCSTMCFVNKDSNGPRTISMEPAEYMYMQQGLKDKLYEHLERKTNNQINFNDQSYNQRYALEASINGHYCTYDFSSASDRVSLSLVESLFRDVPKTLDALVALRSTHTLTPDREKIRLYKYAPMGSALCFPVMATVIYAIAKAHNTDLNCYVYGDDLIVEDDSSYKDLPKNFLRLGLKINEEKSFTRGKFRESCGCDAFDGYIITPIRIKKEIQCDIPESFAALVESSNQLYNAGYWHLAQCLRQIISQNANIAVPTSSVHQNIDGLSFCFATDATDNLRIVQRKAENALYYQRRVLQLVIPKLTTQRTDAFAYHIGLIRCGRGRENIPSHCVIRDTTKRAKLRFMWKDLYYTGNTRYIAA